MRHASAPDRVVHVLINALPKYSNKLRNKPEMFYLIACQAWQCILATACTQLLPAGVSVNWYMQGVYEPHHDIHMQPYPDSAGGQAYNDQGYGSSSLPAQQTSSANGTRLCYPSRGVSLQADGQSSLITI